MRKEAPWEKSMAEVHESLKGIDEAVAMISEHEKKWDETTRKVIWSHLLPFCAKNDVYLGSIHYLDSGRMDLDEPAIDSACYREHTVLKKIIQDLTGKQFNLRVLVDDYHRRADFNIGYFSHQNGESTSTSYDISGSSDSDGVDFILNVSSL